MPKRPKAIFGGYTKKTDENGTELWIELIIDSITGEVLEERITSYRLKNEKEIFEL